MKVINSDTRPEIIFLDRIVTGKAYLRVRWNIVEVEKEDPISGDIRTSYDYLERMMPWDLKIGDEDDEIGKGTMPEILSFLKRQETEILKWTMVAEINVQ